VLQGCHDSPMEGHQGTGKTYRQVREMFSWKCLEEDLLNNVKECITCQEKKDEHTHPAGLLQPLHILDNKWESISMEFIIGFPRAQQKDFIFIVVDRLTKFAHFFSIATNFQYNTGGRIFFQRSLQTTWTTQNTC
jgi:hypothetical protein